MTPDKARDLLEAMEDSCPPPYTKNQITNRLFEVRDKNHQIVAYHIFEGEADVIVAAPDLAEIVAGMRQVYDYEVTLGDGVWHQMGHEFDSLESAQEWVADRRRVSQARIITRYVTGWEVVQDGRT